MSQPTCHQQDYVAQGEKFRASQKQLFSVWDMPGSVNSKEGTLQGGCGLAEIWFSSKRFFKAAEEQSLRFVSSSRRLDSQASGVDIRISLGATWSQPHVSRLQGASTDELHHHRAPEQPPQNKDLHSLKLLQDSTISSSPQSPDT